MSTSAKDASFWSPETTSRDQQHHRTPHASLHGEHRTLTPELPVHPIPRTRRRRIADRGFDRAAPHSTRKAHALHRPNHLAARRGDRLAPRLPPDLAQDRVGLAQFAVLAVPRFHPGPIVACRPRSAPLVMLGLPHPAAQAPPRTADLGRNRADRRLLRRAIRTVLQHHPHRTRTYLSRIPVCRLCFVHGSNLSGFRASGKPGAVQMAHPDPQRVGEYISAGAKFIRLRG